MHLSKELSSELVVMRVVLSLSLPLCFCLCTPKRVFWNSHCGYGVLGHFSMQPALRNRFATGQSQTQAE